MDTGQEEELQPSRRGEQVHDPSVPEVMGRDHANIRQRRNVAAKERVPRTGLLGPTDVCECIVTRKVTKG